MASSHAHHAHHRYPNPHSNSNPPPHVPSSDFRLPPLKSLNFQFRPLQHDAHPGPDQSAYTAFDVDVNASSPNHPPPVTSPPTSTNGTSFSAFGYLTPTPASAPAYVHRQPFAYQGQTSSQSQQHDHDTSTWQQQHSHGTNQPTSAHSQTPSQVHAQLPSSTQSSSFARTTPLVPTTVDQASTAQNRTPFPAPPKHRSTYPPPSPYTPNTSHSYNPSYPSSSTSTSAPYTPYNTSPGYTANSTSPTFSPSTSPSYASAPHPNTAPPYPSQNAYPTPTSAYPHPPPSPTPTPTQSHAHSSSHYVPPSTSASTYGFDDTRSSTTYAPQGPAQPVRSHSQVQDSRYVISTLLPTCPHSSVSEFSASLAFRSQIALGTPTRNLKWLMHA